MATVDASTGITISEVWDISPNATKSDLVDEVSTSLAHLEAMTANIYGGGFDTFNNLNDALKQSYLWAISEKLGHAKAAFARLAEMS